LAKLANYSAQSHEGEEEEDDPGFRHVGVEIICTPDVAVAIAQQLRNAVEEILEGYTDDDIIDYGVD
jgi:cytochrome c-type biogenesis protein CcmH/NrfF